MFLWGKKDEKKSSVVTFDSLMQLLEKSGEVAKEPVFPTPTEGRDVREMQASQMSGSSEFSQQSQSIPR